MTVRGYRGTSIIRNSAPPLDIQMGLGIDLLWGSGGRQFLMNEVPLYCNIQHARRGVENEMAYSKVVSLDLRYQFVNFGAKKTPHQIRENK